MKITLKIIGVDMSKIYVILREFISGQKIKSLLALILQRWSRRKRRITIMEFWKIVNKLLDVITAFLVILILFGIVLSSNIRNNISALGETLLGSGPTGIIVLISLLWIGRKIPFTIIKLFKAKGLNLRFWNDL